MDEKLVLAMRETFKTAKHLKTKAKMLISKSEELEKNEAVIEYIKVQEEIKRCCGVQIYSDEELMKKAFEEQNISVTNNIYVYMGTHAYENGILRFCKKVPYNDKNAYVSRYVNIECRGDYYHVKTCDRQQFEKEHTVIFLSDDSSEEEYEKLQLLFIKTCIERSQEEAIGEIMKQSKKTT